MTARKPLVAGGDGLPQQLQSGDMLDGFSWVVGKSGTAVAHTGDTIETTLATCTIPANTLGPNGQVEIWALFSYTNNANSKTPRVKFGAMVVQNSALISNACQQFLLRVANANSATAQVAFPTSASGLGSGASATPTAGTVDTTANVDITFTGQLANSTDTITLVSWMVRATYGA